MNEDIYIHLIDFPDVKTTEAITKNEDCSYSVFLNSKLSNAMIRDAYEHAIRHIRNGDFEKDDVQEIETEAHEQ